MKRLIPAALVTVLITANSQSAIITLGTDAPPGSPLTMTSPGVSGLMTVDVTNNVDVDAPADLLTSWTVVLDIVPVGAATGLSFNLPPSGPVANPPNYVLAANGFGISAVNTGNSMTAFDFEFPATGTQVTTAGANLFQMDFLADPGAEGLFNIVARSSPSSIWTDNQVIPMTSPFANDGAAIGQVSVRVIPEAGSLFVWGILLTAGLVGRWRSSRCRWYLIA